MQRKIVAIIVTFNPTLIEFQEQLRAVVAEEMTVVIVDNASANVSDFDRQLSIFDSKTLILLKNSENIGLAAAQNIGIVEAQRLEATHVIFFDQDSVPQAGFMRELLAMEQKLISAEEQFAAIGPASYDPTTKEYYPITRYVGPFIRRHYPEGALPVEATFLISSGSLVRMKVIDEVGLMRSELFIDYIDVEWCLRARRLGYRCFVASAARMSHRIGDMRLQFLGRTISSHSSLRRYYLIRNSFLMLRLRYVPLSYKVREVLLNFLRVSVFFYLSKDRLNYLRLMRRAISDGMAGRYGKHL
jgi:rhamnosyltransferase